MGGNDTIDAGKLVFIPVEMESTSVKLNPSYVLKEMKNPKTVKNMSDNNAKVTMLNSGSAFTTKHDPSQVKINQSFEHLLKLYKRTHNAGESVSELVNQQLKDGLLIESEIYWGGND